MDVHDIISAAPMLPTEVSGRDQKETKQPRQVGQLDLLVLNAVLQLEDVDTIYDFRWAALLVISDGKNIDIVPALAQGLRVTHHAIVALVIAVRDHRDVLVRGSGVFHADRRAMTSRLRRDNVPEGIAVSVPNILQELAIISGRVPALGQAIKGHIVWM